MNRLKTKILLAAMLVFISASPAMADIEVQTGAGPEFELIQMSAQTEDLRGVQKYKVPFRLRHPKIYKAYRGGRLVCIVTKPVVDLAASVAQIMFPFVR